MGETSGCGQRRWLLATLVAFSKSKNGIGKTERDHRQYGEVCRAALRRSVERVDRDRKGRLRPRLPISDPYFGLLANAGDSVFTITGKVGGTGAITVTVSGGGRSATGSGRLAGNMGTGSWMGGACSGTWTAERRGP